MIILGSPVPQIARAGLAQKKASFTAWDKKESPVSGRASSFLYFKLQSFRVVLLSQSPNSAQTFGRTSLPLHGQAGFARGALKTRGVVFVDRGGAPGLAEDGWALSEPCRWCLSQGSTSDGHSLQPVALTGIAQCVSQLALSILLCALSEV